MRRLTIKDNIEEISERINLMTKLVARENHKNMAFDSITEVNDYSIIVAIDYELSDGKQGTCQLRLTYIDFNRLELLYDLINGVYNEMAIS